MNNYIIRQKIVWINKKTLAYDIINANSDKVPIETILVNIDKAISPKDAIAELPIVIAIWQSDINEELINKLNTSEKKNIILEVNSVMLYVEKYLPIFKELKKFGHEFIIKLNKTDTDFMRVNAYADYIKFDMDNIPDAVLNGLQDLDQSIYKIASKVNTPEDYRIAEVLNANLFEGEYISEQEKFLLNIKADTDKGIIDLISCDVDNREEFENIIRRNDYLSSQILLFHNSKFSEQTDSIEEAIDNLGIEKIKNWALLVNYGNNNSKMFVTSYFRATFCSILADMININKDTAYTVGLMSALDCVPNDVLNYILTKYHMSTEVIDAIMYREGTYGLILNLAISYESSDNSRADIYIRKLSLDKDKVELKYNAVSDSIKRMEQAYK